MYEEFFYISLCSTAPRMIDFLNDVATNITHKWFKFGIHLNIPLNLLRSLEMRNSDPMLCLAEVFSIWKRGMYEEFSWATIIAVLQSPAIDESEIAAKLREKYGAGTNTPGSSTSSSTGDDHDTGSANPSLHKPHTGE